MARAFRSWMIPLPFIAIFVGLYLVSEGELGGAAGRLPLAGKLVPWLERVAGTFTDFKFKYRGGKLPKNKVVIVEIDDLTLSKLGRWPWPRDQIGFLLTRILDHQPAAVGLDLLFADVDAHVPDGLALELKKRGLDDLVERFEPDHALTRTIEAGRSSVVLGWGSASVCQPAFDGPAACPVSAPEYLAQFPSEMPAFSFSMKSMPGFEPARTPVYSMVSPMLNLPEYTRAARHAGVLNAFPDADGEQRRTSLVMLGAGEPYPVLGLEVARTGLTQLALARGPGAGRESLRIATGPGSVVRELGFSSLGIGGGAAGALAVDGRGMAQINFRGPARTFRYVSAQEVMVEEQARGPAASPSPSEDLDSLLKDAYVLVGMTAIAGSDIKVTPFDSVMPGVEVQASVLDNVLARDFLHPSGGRPGQWALIALMVLGVFGLAATAQKLEALPALGVFAAAFLAWAYVDLEVLFLNNHNWNSGFLYLELVTVAAVTLVAKYVTEEHKKKFLRTAFVKYLAPAVVDSLVKNPEQLSLGGVKKNLTILFSDIRGFTTFSEKMDAKLLSELLNDYLTVMTKIVFDHGGTLDKYIGDAVMAFWGAPIDRPKNALECCEAAIKMMQALHQHQGRLKEKYGVDVQIGIGINSGPVSVGNMGSELSFGYTVIGDAVNLASRLEGATKQYGVSILTTRATMDSIAEAGEELPPHRVLDLVKVKGKKNAVEIFQILDREYSAKGLELFAKGREAYTACRWDEAEEFFRLADVELRPAPDLHDGPSQTYLERCSQLRAESPGPDWDGSWKFDSK